MAKKFNNAEDFMNSLAKSATEGDEVDTEQTPTEEEVQDATESVADAEEEQVKEEEVAPVEEQEDHGGDDSVEAKEDANDIDWDDEAEEKEQEQSNDFSELTKELGFNKVEELIDAFKQQKEAFESIPADLRAAIELAKKGGDYLELLKVSTIDYDQIPDRDLVYHNLRDYFESEEELEEYIDDMGEVDMKIRAKQLRNSLKAEQESASQRLEQESRLRKQEAEKKLKSSIEGISSVKGFKLKPSHKKAILDDFQSGNINNVFYADGDYSKMVENAFKVKYFDSIVDYMRQRVSNDTKREMINDISNPNLNKSKSLPDAKPTEKKPIDHYMDFILKRG